MSAHPADSKAPARLTKRAWGFGIAGFILYAAGANSSSPWVIALASVLVTAPLLALSDVRRMRDELRIAANMRQRITAGEPTDVALRITGAEGAAHVLRHDSGAAALVAADRDTASIALPLARGHYTHLSLTLTLEDRFGMVRAHVPRDVALDATVTSTPSLTTPDVHPSTDTGGLDDGDRGTSARRGTEPVGIRRHEAGDPSHSVNWRALARTGELLVHDRRAPRAQTVVLAIEGGLWTQRDLDRATTACLTAAHALREQGFEVLIAADGQTQPLGAAAHDLLAGLPPHGGSAARPLADPPVSDTDESVMFGREPTDEPAIVGA